MTTNTALIEQMTGVSDSTKPNVPVESRSHGPKGIVGWVAFVAIAINATVVVLIFSLSLLPGPLAALVGVTAGAFLAGRVAKVRGARWWVFAWVVGLVGPTAVNLAFLLVLQPQIFLSTAP